MIPSAERTHDAHQILDRPSAIAAEVRLGALQSPCSVPSPIGISEDRRIRRRGASFGRQTRLRPMVSSGFAVRKRVALEQRVLTADLQRFSTWNESAEHNALSIFFEGGRDGTNVFGCRHGFQSFEGCLLTAGRAGDDRQ